MNTITVREVKGYKVWKYEGTKGFYYVTLWEKVMHGKEFSSYVWFRTIKAAVEYIETQL